MLEYLKDLIKTLTTAQDIFSFGAFVIGLITGGITMEIFGWAALVVIVLLLIGFHMHRFEKSTLSENKKLKDQVDNLKKFISKLHPEYEDAVKNEQFLIKIVNDIGKENMRKNEQEKLNEQQEKSDNK